MDSRFILLILVAGSLLLLGCAGKKAGADKENGSVPAGGGSGGTTAGNGDTGEELADLFNISMDKPVEGEGLDSKTPASD